MNDGIGLGTYFERVFRRTGNGFGVFGEEEVLVMATDVVTVHLLK